MYRDLIYIISLHIFVKSPQFLLFNFISKKVSYRVLFDLDFRRVYVYLILSNEKLSLQRRENVVLVY